MSKSEGYKKALYLYGFYTLIKLIEEYEKEENYEECQIIFDVIIQHNQEKLFQFNIIKYDDFILPTDYKDPKSKQFLRKCWIALGYSSNHYLNNIESYIEETKKLIKSKCV